MTKAEIRMTKGRGEIYMRVDPLTICLACTVLIGCHQQPAPTPDDKGAVNLKRESAMSDREKLIAKIEAQGPAHGKHEIVVSLEDFFTGNNDLGSIGANLGAKQPPIAEFYRVLREIRSKPNVQDVLVRIYDYSDPTSWPYTDTVYVISSAPPEEVKQWVEPLLPDEVYAEWMYGKPAAAPEVESGMTPYSVWWD